MKLILTKKPKSPTMIYGFPSVGLVSTITTKFLIEHLEVEEIGCIESKYLLPLTAIHKSKIVHPITIYYNKKYNLLILQALTEVAGHEWDLAQTFMELGKTLAAKEIIVVESMPTHEKEVNLYYYSTIKSNKLKLKPLTEGIVMGTTAALLLKAKTLPVTCIFSEAHSEFPDSEAAAKVVDALNIYLGIKIDYKPLLEEAKKFEEKLKLLKSMIVKSKGGNQQVGEEKQTYIG
ncbi:proteasome assembly chaperone family protein [Candidatus Woesearchaeota archaeon]|nr:proteasome assembly chaperone family protein [Candidatus Woesearchaeota archaeon]